MENTQKQPNMEINQFDSSKNGQAASVQVDGGKEIILTQLIEGLAQVTLTTNTLKEQLKILMEQ